MIPYRIGVFDSGAGGISVLKSLIHSHNFEEIIYYGDTARVPYGVRSPETIIQYSLEALEFFKSFHLDLLVIACNTVSAYGLKAMQEVAPYPIVGVIEPGVLALKNKISNKDSKILILGTKATIQSKLYSELLSVEGYCNTFGLATSLFVPIVEEGIFEGAVLDSTIAHYFAKYPQTPEAIILGCTHFPLIADSISNYYHKQPLLIHSGEAIMEYLQNSYILKSFDTPPKVTFYASDCVEKLEQIAKVWLIK
ncbi:glutamate racemase [Helicobacter sp. MIT 05-5294]|uniref:glutamate racemase n=1 Tax=Helicobacter sp. MIT 05-5294 TaxID=1548150 RepID=UPI00051FD52C|nr:glutamate racemase [Helicobacter sp. MIT 05-5294]TLD87796.1 glutamate racemase [Helicobacter sp. MIT 05-5294]